MPTRDPRWKGIFEELVSLVGNLTSSETKFMKFSNKAIGGGVEPEIVIPSQITEALVQLVDPDERFS